MVGVDVGGESDLVEDVALVGLDEEEDALWEWWGVFGGAVGLVSGGEAVGEGRNGVVGWWEVGFLGGLEDRVGWVGERG